MPQARLHFISPDKHYKSLFYLFILPLFLFLLVNQILARLTQRRHRYYIAIILARQAVENDVTSTAGHGGLGLATSACDNLCSTWKA